MKVEDFIGARVRIHDSLVSIFFSDFYVVSCSYDSVRTALLISDKIIIKLDKSYIPKSVLNLLNNVQYIIKTDINYQYSIYTRKEIVDYVNENNWRSKSLPKYFDYSSMDDEEFFLNIKIFYVSGRLVNNIDESNVYSLYEAFVSNTKEFIKLYYENTLSYPVLESIFLTFLLRAKNVDKEEVSNYHYHILLKRVNKIFPKALVMIKNYAIRKDRNKSTLLSFLLQLKELMV